MNHINRRTLLWGGMALATSPWAHTASSAPAEPALPRVRLLGEATLPYRFNFQDTVVGGLSALDYDPVDDLWYALSDDRSEHNPARFYTFKMRVSREGLSHPVLQRVVFLKQTDGSTYPNVKHYKANPDTLGPMVDPEGLRFRPQTRTLLWSSEGSRYLGLPPFVREMTLDGRHLRELETPAHLYYSRHTGNKPTPLTGPWDNFSLEGLAISPNGQHIWASMEGTLHQDGNIPTLASGGGPCRFTCFDAATGKAIRQIAYMPDAVPRAPLIPRTFVDNGVSEILMHGEHHLLVLERSYSLGTGLSIRLYRIDVNAGSNTLNESVLHPGQYTPVTKTLVTNFDQLGLSLIDNTEGMAWGPHIPPAPDSPPGLTPRQTLVFVSDDNFNPLQTTQFIAVELILNPAVP